MKVLIASFLVLFSRLVLQAQVSDFHAVDFSKADSIAAICKGHSLQNLPLLAHKLTGSLPTEEEKFRAIYKWVCHNIGNDFQLYRMSTLQKDRIKNPEELKAWNKKFSALAFKKLFQTKRTVCTGYAYLVRELALHAGLSCEIINGYGRTAVANIRGVGKANHSWNAIRLNNKWYLCDATWSSGSIDTKEGTFITKFDEAYFLADPSLFARNHYPLDSVWLLLDDKPTLNEFLNAPLIYSSIYKYQINKLLPEAFDITAGKGETVSFRFNGNKAIEEAELYINGTGTVNSISSPLHTSSDGYCLDHVFTSKGTYIVHVLVNHNIVFTYTVNII